MKSIISICTGICFSLLLYAEGSKELTPSNTGNCYVQFNESIGGQRYFAMVGADTVDRLYIHIAHIGEVINMGFAPLTTDGGAQFRIKDPDGNIVYGFQSVPSTTGTGYIGSYNEAEIGPNTLSGGTGGYTPFTHTATKTGDYYIEFERTSATSRFLFNYFDITVSSSATGNAIDGRLWSYAWDLNTNNYTNSAYGIFYVYSDDKYVTRINLNGIQPYSFVIACNNTGALNTGDLSVDRKSVPDNNTVYPKYKIFLNSPDTAVYERAEIPSMVENLQIVGTPVANEPVEFYINMNKAGTLEIFLDIDDVDGYQPDGRDIALVEHIEAGGDNLLWDGKDGLGNQVTETISVIVTSKFSTGVTHLPIYDAEKNPNGFLVTRIEPDGPENLVLYWDDSDINYGTLPAGQTITMLSDNTTANGHIWSTDSNNSEGFGDWHTINTWWNAYEINNLSSFDFILLPIELSSWEVNNKGSYVELTWTTQSETNNHLFEIERSADGKKWEHLITTVGAGNSNYPIHYTEIDESPLSNNTSYYRLKQINFDGSVSYSSIKTLSQYEYSDKIQVYEHTQNHFVIISDFHIDSLDIQIYNTIGKNISHKTTIEHISTSEIEINITHLPAGTYIIRTPYGDKLVQKK
ncbi:MAG: T9SS type A sorting domain-containing protein [Bacteroidales bacterium]